MRRLLAAITIGSALALVALSVIGFVARFHWSFDLFNHFRPQYLFFALAGLLIARLQRVKLAGFAFAAAALINAVLIAPLYIPRADQAGPLNELSIVSYNSWLRNDDWPSIASVLDQDPDIVFFTEASPGIRTAIRKLESDYLVFENEDNFVLVKRRSELGAMRLDTETLGRDRAIALKLSVQGADVTVVAVHVPAPLNAIATQARDQSFDSIASWLARQDDLVIMIGDFNATPWSRAFRNLENRTGLINSQRGFGIQATWPSYPQSHFNWLLRAPIDHCIHSPSIYTTERSVGAARKSNHHPLFVRLGVPSATR